MLTGEMVEGSKTLTRGYGHMNSAQVSHPPVTERSDRLDGQAHSVHVVSRNLMKNWRVKLTIDQHQGKVTLAQVKPCPLKFRLLIIECRRCDDSRNSDLGHFADSGRLQFQVIGSVGEN